MTILVAVPSTAAEAAGEHARPVADLEGMQLLLDRDKVPVTVVLGPDVDLERALPLTSDLRLHRPEVGFVLLRDAVDSTVLRDALRAGIREVVETYDPVALADAVKRSDELNAALAERSHVGDDDASSLGRVVTVFSAKGGCGKTTISTNLAAALADGGRRNVVIVDLDLAFGDVAIALQLFPSRTIADAVPMGEADIDFDGVQSLLTPHSPGLTSLVAPVEPGAADTIPASLVGRILELLREHFDYVIVDTPPAFDDQVLAAFDASDAIVLLATLDIPALKNLKLTLETLDLLNYPRERWRIVLNRADSKVGLATSEVEKTLRTAITAQVPSSRDVPATVNRGVPIVLDDAKHPVSVAIKSFADRDIVGTLTPAAKQEKVPAPLRNDRRGFLRRRAKA
ncbi:AAA family ATPase [Aquipuribacter sp. SD81]|uniref:AAA family ATPase n=1 Tax=Aquipuribacter sp. SD81 TaxID=3127703 RepID=UPI00301B4714